MVKRSFDDLYHSGVMTFSDGYRTKRSELGQPGFRILRVADVQDWSIATEGQDFVRNEFAHKVGYKLSEHGDILLTTKGTVGRVAIYRSQDEKVVYSPQLCFFRVADKEQLDSRFLAYWFKSSSFKEQALRRSNNTDMAPYINLKDIQSLQIELPSIAEQQAIAEVLGALDDKIAANDRAASSLVELGDAHFAPVLTDSPTTATTIEDLVRRNVLTMSDGYRTKRGEHGEPGLRILRAGDIRGGQIFPEGADFVSHDYERQIGKKKSESHDIVLTTKGTVGRVAVVPKHLDPVVYSPQLCYFRVVDHDTLDWGYLAAWFRSRDFEVQAANRMYKSDMAPYINLQDARSLVVPLPDTETLQAQGKLQRTFIERFHSLHRENQKLANTRNELLPLLMSGKVRVRDAAKVAEEVV